MPLQYGHSNPRRPTAAGGIDLASANPRTGAHIWQSSEDGRAHWRVDALYKVWGKKGPHRTVDASVGQPFDKDISIGTRRDLRIGASQSTIGTTWLTVLMGESWHSSHDIGFSQIDKSI